MLLATTKQRVRYLSVSMQNKYVKQSFLVVEIAVKLFSVQSLIILFLILNY